MSTPPYFVLRAGIQRLADAYRVELSHVDPGSDAQVPPQIGTASFDAEELRALQQQPVEYGAALARQLFADDGVKRRFHDVEQAAQATSSFLRVVVAIDPSAAELHGLRWELLRHPEAPERALAMSERVLLSRFMVSRDWRPVKVRAQSELRALIAVAAPPPEQLANLKLAAVDFEGEVGRVKRALGGGVRVVETLGGPGDPFTPGRLCERLRAGVDVLYLVAHGGFKRGDDGGAPVLILQDEQGNAARVAGDDLAGRISELQQPPRLAVLASCQSSGDGEQTEAALRQTAQGTLAGRLADAGVAAVVAMQGFISMITVEKMMPVLFAELLRDGQIDRALAVARGQVRDRWDAWMPALFTRLISGRIWYTPGFQGERRNDAEVWRDLLEPIRRGQVVPILGPRLLESVHGADTARNLAERVGFPFTAREGNDLPRVVAFIGATRSRQAAIDEYRAQVRSDLLAAHGHWMTEEQRREPDLLKLLKLVGEKLRKDNPDDVYGILARLPAPVYLTTNLDPLLEWALAANETPKKKPQQVVTRWRAVGKPEESGKQVIEKPTAERPLVYHFFGVLGSNINQEVVVLNEEYLFDYLLDTDAQQLIPSEVDSALVSNSLLLLGFKLTDWHFRVLFRLMMRLEGREKMKNLSHVAVQVESDVSVDVEVKRAREYLGSYFGKEANISIYWGSASEFLNALETELKKAPPPPAAAAANDDEFA